MFQALYCTRGPSSCCSILLLAFILEPRNPIRVPCPVPGDYFFPQLDLAPPPYVPGQVCTRGPIPLGTGLLPPPPGPLVHVPALLWLLGSLAFPPVPTLLCFPAIYLQTPGTASASGPLKLNFLSSSTPPTVWLSHSLFIFLAKAMAPHSTTLAWKIPWTEEPGRLQSMGSLESDTTERLHFHFSLSCIGEANGNPLQCSCLENPRDGGAWWAAVMGSHRVGHD